VCSKNNVKRNEVIIKSMSIYLVLIFSLLFTVSCVTENDDESIPEQRDDDGIVLNIPLNGSLQNPAFSPNGESFVFTRFINGYNLDPAEIYEYDPSSEQLTLLVSDGSGNINLPGSSWNNNKIIFASTREPHDEIYLISENGEPGDEIQITDRPNKVAYEPTLSPDGEWTVFESHVLDEEDNGIITKYKIDGSSQYVELTAHEDDCRQPNWSPNGDKILYQKQENDQWNIWIMNTDGTDEIQVTSNIGNCTDASFSGDGQFIVFSSDFDVDIANIYKITSDGNELTKLTNFAGYDGAVSISSDNSKLVFESINDDPDECSGTKIVLLDL